MSEKQLKIPEVGEFLRGVGVLVKIEDGKPVPPPKDYIFEDITARCEMRLNGEVIKEIETLNDHYGLETSVKTAIEEMKDYAKRRGITDKSDVEIVVVRVAEQTRMRPKNRESYYATGYMDFESLRYGSHRNLPEDVETVVWSSKTPHKTQDEKTHS